MRALAPAMADISAQRWLKRGKVIHVLSRVAITCQPGGLAGEAEESNMPARRMEQLFRLNMPLQKRDQRPQLRELHVRAEVMA